MSERTATAPRLPEWSSAVDPREWAAYLLPAGGLGAVQGEELPRPPVPDQETREGEPPGGEPRVESWLVGSFEDSPLEAGGLPAVFWMAWRELEDQVRMKIEAACTTSFEWIGDGANSSVAPGLSGLRLVGAPVDSGLFDAVPPLVIDVEAPPIAGAEYLALLDQLRSAESKLDAYAVAEGLVSDLEEEGVAVRRGVERQLATFLLDPHQRWRAVVLSAAADRSLTLGSAAVVEAMESLLAQADLDTAMSAAIALRECVVGGAERARCIVNHLVDRRVSYLSALMDGDLQAGDAE